MRIYFTAEDLGRVRMAAAPDPMWETVFSVFRLDRPGPAAVFGRWRRRAVPAMRPADLEMLRPLVNGAYYPDFLTPAEGGLGLPHAIEALLRTPTARLRAEMEQLARLGGPLPSWMRGLADGDGDVLGRLAGAMRSQFAVAVAPFWAEARAHVDADRARRARVLLEHGGEGLLKSFRPMMRWEPPALVVDVPSTQSIHLNGRGLLLVPSYLSWKTPDTLRDPNLTPVLVYPVEHDLTRHLDAARPAGPGALAALIGPTRADVLEAIGDGQTTSELAGRVGVSAASISQHTAVLRDARLIRTTRIGKAVLHTITPLGAAMLDDAPRRRAPIDVAAGPAA
ncbi:winged helix-turn-helix domain-containing protein [Micromonospora sp. NPDC005413]|uniref:ArsR/SmtB family transcription factor n=1 Tax=Micromonospora sp. NPDC005413 TaxID=3154563 RepID=UPI0033A00C06